MIESFIAGINDIEDIMTEWHDYVAEQRENDLETIIQEERLKPEETRKFLENSFREGAVKTVGTDIDKIMPPVSRFGGGSRAKKKQTVVDKLKAFFEKYFGIGGPPNFTRTDVEDEHKTVVYDFNQTGSTLMVAEEPVPYGKDKR